MSLARWRAVYRRCHVVSPDGVPYLDDVTPCRQSARRDKPRHQMERHVTTKSRRVARWRVTSLRSHVVSRAVVSCCKMSWHAMSPDGASRHYEVTSCREPSLRAVRCHVTPRHIARWRVTSLRSHVVSPDGAYSEYSSKMFTNSHIITASTDCSALPIATHSYP